MANLFSLCVILFSVVILVDHTCYTQEQSENDLEGSQFKEDSQKSENEPEGGQFKKDSQKSENEPEGGQFKKDSQKSENEPEGGQFKKDSQKIAESIITVPEDVISQSEFITNSDIYLGVDMEFDDEREFITVPTHYGPINGFRDISSNGKPFYSYLGIPFAKPPVGQLRFKNPEFPEKWEEIRDGTVSPAPCSQMNINEFLTKVKPGYVGEEDCLYLNVFTPRPNMSLADLPVLLYIHGGHYISGGAEVYKPHYLLNEDVVLVVIQYRLGVLGFMSTEDDIMPGNLGLKDQAKSILWVHRNIEFFGGSPLKVTLFGSDAGAASVHFQILSHHTIGLFSRGIMQSGTALCPWATGGVHKQVAHHVGAKFQCKSFTDDSQNSADDDENSSKNNGERIGKDDSRLNQEDKNLENDPQYVEVDATKDVKEESEELKLNDEQDIEDTIVTQAVEKDESEEMKHTEEQDLEVNIEDEDAEVQEEPEPTNVDGEEKKVELISEELLQCLQEVDAKNLTMVISDYLLWNMFPAIFGPRVDDNFLPETPEYLMKEMRHKRLDLIIGTNKDEGAYITSSTFASDGRRMVVKSHFQLVGPISLEFTDEDIAPLNMSLKAYDHYIHGLDLEKSNADDVAKLFGDRHYAVCSDITAMMHADNNVARKKNVFVYELHHRGSRSNVDEFHLSVGQNWVSHGDELNYLFPNEMDKEERGEVDRRITDVMTNMWANFANNGNPTYNESLGFEWEPFTSSERKHLTIKPEPRMEDDHRSDVREFWTSLPTKQNMNLFPKKFVSSDKNNENKSQSSNENKKKDEL